MATALAAGNILEFVVVCTIPDQTSETVYHAVVAAVAGGITDADAAFSFSAQVSVPFTSWLCSYATYYGSSCRILYGVPTNRAQGDRNLTNPGLIGLPPTPSQCRGLVEYQTNLAGRSQRGRSYIPFPSSVWVTAAGFVTAPGLLALQTIATFWNGTPRVLVRGGGSATINPIILHRGPYLPPPPPRPVPGTYDRIVSSTVSARFATQRKSGEWGRTNFAPF
jgi:hypothetical protein